MGGRVIVFGVRHGAVSRLIRNTGNNFRFGHGFRTATVSGLKSRVIRPTPDASLDENSPYEFGNDYANII